MMSRAVLVAAESAAVIEFSERSALLARLMALDAGLAEGEFIDRLIADHARGLGIKGLVGAVDDDEPPPGSVP